MGNLVLMILSKYPNRSYREARYLVLLEYIQIRVNNGSHSDKAPNMYLPLPCRLDISNIIYKHYLCPFYKQLETVKKNPMTIPGLPRHKHSHGNPRFLEIRRALRTMHVYSAAY